MVEKEGRETINIGRYRKLQYPTRYEETLREELLDLYELYKENAWGYKWIDAVSGAGTGGKAIPLTMLQALIPLHYFGEWDEIRAIQSYVEDNVDPTPDQTLKTDRIGLFLAGLAYLQQLTASREVYNKMVELGDSLYNNAFDASTDMVYSKVNPETGSSPKEDSQINQLSEGLQSLLLLSRITGDAKYKTKVVNCRDAWFNNLAGTGLPFQFYDPTTGGGKETELQDSNITTFIQGLVTGYLQTNDTEWLRKAHQMITEFEDHMLNTEYYGIDTVNADTGNVMDNISSTYGLGELPTWLVRVGRTRLARKLFDTAVDLFLINGYIVTDVDYKTRTLHGTGGAHAEIADSAEALYAVTGNNKYLYPIWKQFKGCKKYCRQEYGYVKIDPFDKTPAFNKQNEWVLGDSVLSVGYALFSRNPYLQRRKPYRLTWGYPLHIFP